MSAFLLSGCTISNIWDKKPAGLDVTTNPKAQVFLDGKSVGETPYKNDNITAGTYVLKLTPIATDSATFADWETSLTLTPQATTIVSRTFAASLADVESSTLQLIPVSGSKVAYLSVISDPDTVNVTLDNKPYGFTPLSKVELSAGNHSLLVSSPGYHAQSLTVNTTIGYNLIANVHLGTDSLTLVPPINIPTAATSSAALAIPSISPAPSPKAVVATPPSLNIAKPYVVVNDTPDTQLLGGLNVRTEPNSASAPLGLAKIGEKLPYLDTNNSGWHQVTFEGKSGWISGKYSTVQK